ncbi:MAG: HAD family phosphatase [Planctomycetes bacterium]|nr:HAD family phosphatase [Planctomycetota bacterium]
MKTIIFDFGNVVGFFDHYRALEKLKPFTSLSPQEMFASVYQGPLEDQVERGLLSSAAFLRRARELWQLRCNVEFLAHAVADIFWKNPEVCDLIPRLKGRYRLVLGSNTNAIHARRYLSQFAELLRHFDALVLSHEVGTRKPDSDFFHHCQRAARAKPSECVFVDDMPANIDGARACGFHGIVYQPNDGLADQLRALGVDLA